MKQEYVTPFLAPAQAAWLEEFGCPLKVRAAETVPPRYSTSDIIAIFGVGGDLEGQVLHCFPEDTVAGLIRHTLGGKHGPRDPESLSALAEIAAVLAGDVTVMLSAAGYSCNVSPPAICESKKAVLVSTASDQVMVTFESDMGLFRVRIGLVEASVELRNAA
jgi:CheY-specific phosphatase CheX